MKKITTQKLETLYQLLLDCYGWGCGDRDHYCVNVILSDLEDHIHQSKYGFMRPRFGSGWKITGKLVQDNKNPELLNGTMLDIYNKEKDILITVGWQPEEDVNGGFQICVIKGCELKYTSPFNETHHRNIFLIEQELEKIQLMIRDGKIC